MITMLVSISVSLAEPDATYAVAITTLPPGTVLRAEHLYELSVPKALATDRVLSVEQAIGRMLREPVFEDELLREERLTDPEVGPGFQALIPQHLRLVRLALPRPSDFIGPWSVVDVLRVRDDEACFLAEGVRVVGAEASDGSLTSDGSRPFVAAALHLAVEPEAAGPLGAAAPSELAFALRNPSDKRSFEDRPVCDKPRTQVE